MKEGWKEKRLGDIATYINGFAFKPCDWGYKGKPIIRIQNLTDVDTSFNRCSREDIPSKYNVTQGDILISWSATLGVFEWEREDSLLNQHIFKVVFDKGEINKSFFKYAVSISIGEMSKHTNGATMKHIRKGDFDNIIIPVPPLSEQDRIVKKLDEAFAKIDALKQNAEKGLQAVKDLWQATLKEELKPKEGWVKNILNTIVQVINGRAYSKEELLRKGKYKVLRVGNFFTNDSWYYSDFELEENKYCEKGDLLYAWSASFGPKIWDGDKVIYHYHIWKMIPSYTVDKMFLYYWLQSPVFEHQVMSNLHGATMTHITKGLMESCMLQIPSVNEQKQIVSKIEKVANICLELQNNYEQELSEYEALKQSILRKAFSGEL